MENSNILLSICIPTYNGGDYLIENLDALIPQIEHSSYEVELIISENGSSQENYSKLCDYINSSPLDIDFTHHNSNIGGRANFAYVVSKAKGKYVYLLGDDDVLSPNFLETVCGFLLDDKFSIIYLNFLAADANLQNAEIMSRQYSEACQVFSFADFVSNKCFDLTFMSSLIFVNENWQKGLGKVRDEHYGYEWLAAILLGSVMSSKPCMFYYYPLVLQRNPPKPWIKNYPVFKCIGQQNIYIDLDCYVKGISERNYVEGIIPYRAKLFEQVSRDPNFYLNYEEDFKQTLEADDFKMLQKCLHSRFHKLLYFYYRFKQLQELFKIGMNKIRKHFL